MILSLDVRRARKGDCLLLHYGSRTDPGLILIDGGPGQVYRPQLQPRLAQIRAARRLADEAPLPVDLLMVSHIDDDHIAGILELTAELVAAKDAMKPLPLRIRRFWHNTFDDILGNSPAELLAAVTASFGAAALADEPEAEGLDPACAQVLASVGQGIRLRDDARRLRLRLNPEYARGLVMATRPRQRHHLGRGLGLTVVGPMKPELLSLQKEHDTWLKKSAADRQPASALAAFTDTSIPNLSSLVALAEAGGKRLLLTGDARGDKILEGLEWTGLLLPGGTLPVDLLKVPHHGSDRNLTSEFFRRLPADHYVFSGDGEHGNPERETLEMLREARGDAAFLIHFTYPVAEIDAERKRDWDRERAKEQARKATNPKTKVRGAWSAARQSLGAWFAAHADYAARLRVVPPEGPHVIDLLEPLGF
jgi:hypothetical protein